MADEAHVMSFEFRVRSDGSGLGLELEGRNGSRKEWRWTSGRETRDHSVGMMEEIVSVWAIDHDVVK